MKITRAWGLQAAIKQLYIARVEIHLPPYVPRFFWCAMMIACESSFDPRM
jgi:hypothetical protein